MLKEKRIKTTTAVYSDVGKVRKANEDSYYISKNENLIIVCDGMGGQVAGGLASKIAVETIKDVFTELSDKQIREFTYEQEHELASASQRLIAAIRLANRRIYKVSTKFPRLRGMGTTVVALALDKSFATMVHVGDSRIFRYSENNVLQLTEDHSWLNELIEDKEINEEQIETFAQKNVITRALGTGPTIKIDIHCEKYKRDDVYVLCTDGMHNTVGSADIKKIIDRSNGSIDAVTHRLIRKAIKRDGSDNVTVAVARIEQDSKDTKQQAVSITIPEEGAKILTKSDKYIQDNYSEPKLQGNKMSMPYTLNSRSFLIPLLILITGFISFMLGTMLKGQRINAGSQGVQAQRLASINPSPQTDRNAVAQIIQPSPIQEDAVLAFVFFNSENDFEKARLSERGLLLNKLNPYDQTGPAITGNFSIFLIDANNNVINKTSGIQIPNPKR